MLTELILTGLLLNPIQITPTTVTDCTTDIIPVAAEENGTNWIIEDFYSECGQQLFVVHSGEWYITTLSE